MIENAPSAAPTHKRQQLGAGAVVLLIAAFVLQIVGYVLPVAVTIGAGAGPFAAAVEEELNAQGLTGEDLFDGGLADDDSMPSPAEARALANATLTQGSSLIPFNTIISEEGEWEEIRCSFDAWDGGELYFARSIKTFEVAPGTSESSEQTIADFFADEEWPVYVGGADDPTWVSFDLSESADDIDVQSYDDALGVQAYTEGGKEYVVLISDEGCYR
ncbi:hypothetical protein KXS11_11960 [Plantibacter flavus]|uniref:hypothetical protein n=1 Tax=Plantibacter flavus TaxID=150123 RepID=UPI003F156CBE